MTTDQKNELDKIIEELAVEQLESQMKSHLFVTGAMAAYLGHHEVCALVHQAFCTLDPNISKMFKSAVGKTA